MPGLKAIILALLLPATAGAQGASATARTFLDAYTNGQFAVMASMADSASLPVVRAEAVRIFELFEKSRNRQSAVPADTVSDGLARMAAGLQLMMPNILRSMFARVETESDIRALTDRELLSRWFEARSPGYLTREGETRARSMLPDLPPEAIAALQDAMTLVIKPLTFEIVGEVVERPGVAHVLYRTTGPTPGTTGVLTFQLAPDGKWYVPFSRMDEQLGVLTGYVLRSFMPPASR